MKTLRLNNLSVTIDDKKLLDDISFSIEQGTMTALLGHNGAGKSTLMKAIIHIVEHQSGTIEMMETYDQETQLLSFKQQLAYLPEEPMLMPELTVTQPYRRYYWL